jgi:4-amino-4-deoxy-L-arabinose transferase-like glycosyltransferase
MKPVIPVLVVSFAAKIAVLLLVYSADPSSIVAGDTASYENPARAMLTLGRFSSSPEEPDQIETLRTPGYPAFIAAIFRIFGDHRLAVAIVQIVISTATIAVVYLLSLQLWQPRVALLAACGLALDPLSFVYASSMQSETLFAFGVGLMAVEGIRLMRTDRILHATGFGAAAAGSVLVRPIAYYLFLPTLAAIALRRLLDGVTPLRTGAIVLAALLPWLVAVEGWKLRNYTLTGRAEIAQITSVNLAWYRGAGILALREGISFWEARERLARSMEGGSDASPGALSARYEREGLALILAHPVLFARLQLFGLAKILAGPGRADLLHYFAGQPYDDAPDDAIGVSESTIRRRFEFSSVGTAIPVVYASLYLVLLYAGIAVAQRAVWVQERALRPQHLFLWWLVFYLVVVAAGPEAYARFRVPVMPLLVMYAARGWSAAVRG